MTARSSRSRNSPTRTSPDVVTRCVRLRLRLRAKDQSSSRPGSGIAQSTAHRILVSCHLNRLSHLDRATGEPIRHFERDHPRSMIHGDVKAIGNIPDSGWRSGGRSQGDKNRAAAPDEPRNTWHDLKLGRGFISFVSDDRSRVVYSEAHDNEAALTPAPCSFEPMPGSPSEASPSSGSCPTTDWPTRRLRHRAATSPGMRVKQTWPYRPQATGKIERFHRTLADRRAETRCSTSEAKRREALEEWVHDDNHHPPHTPCGNWWTFSRLINLPGQDSQAT